MSLYGAISNKPHFYREHASITWKTFRFTTRFELVTAWFGGQYYGLIYHSIRGVIIPSPGQSWAIFKIWQIGHLGNFFCQMLCPCVSLGPFIFTHFYTFHCFQDLNQKLGQMPYPGLVKSLPPGQNFAQMPQGRPGGGDNPWNWLICNILKFFCSCYFLIFCCFFLFFC